jgi:phospholipase C
VALDRSDLRAPDSLPDPSRPAGTVNEDLPFDHIVVVMMENHSFDNVLGELSRAGQEHADGLTFGPDGRATNSNPGATGTPETVTAFPFTSTKQGTDVSQTWNATHEQIGDGLMDGFVRSVNSTQPMGYYTPDLLPFAYSLARTFTVANRWFCSAPCQTIPNRRFLLAGTAYGSISTSVSTLFDGSPPNGTICDRLNAHRIEWRNYFTDVPGAVVIPSIIERNLKRLYRINRFFEDCASGQLPAVSFVDPEAGVLSFLGTLLAKLPLVSGLGSLLSQHGGDEEDPQDMRYGEAWARRVVEAVMNSPLWPRTLLIYTYDEHGGYYDHVAPPAAIAPDSIGPKLGSGDVTGGYDIYGPRVPAVVVSPYSRPNAVTGVVHDHTSVLATIETKWNLPALSYRDANAATVMDFLNVDRPAFMTPPTLGGAPGSDTEADADTDAE